MQYSFLKCGFFSCIKKEDLSVLEKHLLSVEYTSIKVKTKSKKYKV